MTRKRRPEFGDDLLPGPLQDNREDAAAGTCRIGNGELIARNLEATLLLGAGKIRERVAFDLHCEGLVGVVRRPGAIIRYGTALDCVSFVCCCGLPILRRNFGKVISHRYDRKAAGGVKDLDTFRIWTEELDLLVPMLACDRDSHPGPDQFLGPLRGCAAHRERQSETQYDRPECV